MPAKKEKVAKITLSTVKSEFLFTDSMIKKYLPEPELARNPHYSSASSMKLWPRELVEQIAEQEEVKALLEKRRASKQKREDKAKQEHQKVIELLVSNSLDHIISSCDPNRKFVVHVGPTNSGKTYTAIQALKTAQTGVYLGPLRLLALEVYDKLNDEGIPCTLLTGEEHIKTPKARITASTIEMCDYTKHYDIAVIDEAQMIADKDRGGCWAQAILQINASEIHICVAPEGRDLVCDLVKKSGAHLAVICHGRLSSLVVTNGPASSTDIRTGDAFIAFSRKSVLRLVDKLEKRNVKASVIYGALPPASRREEVRKFVAGETDVIVATDAIGMGISIPINRVVFTELKKFDGTTQRLLTNAEIRQIAGRAGRFGFFKEFGFVSSYTDIKIVQDAIELPIESIKSYVIPFPTTALDSDIDLMTLLSTWESLPKSSAFERASVENSISLLALLQKYVNIKNLDKKLLYSLITCPVDANDQKYVLYWLQCCKRIIDNKIPVSPQFRQDSLRDCEIAYKAYDIYHQMMRRAGYEKDCSNEKKQILVNKINGFLKDKKDQKTCILCGSPISSLSEKDLCRYCQRKRLKFDSLWL